MNVDIILAHVFVNCRRLLHCMGPCNTTLEQLEEGDLSAFSPSSFLGVVLY